MEELKLVGKEWKEIDWDKITSLEDMKTLLKELEMKVDPEKCGEGVKKYLK
jgi:hypothetical protein